MVKHYFPSIYIQRNKKCVLNRFIEPSGHCCRRRGCVGGETTGLLNLSKQVRLQSESIPESSIPEEGLVQGHVTITVRFLPQPDQENDRIVGQLGVNVKVCC